MCTASRATLLAWRNGPEVNGTLPTAASNAHDFFRLPVAHVMPMRDDAGPRLELAQQFWPHFQIELGREEKHDHRCLAHVCLKKVLVEKTDVFSNPGGAGVFLAFSDALRIDIDTDAAGAELSNRGDDDP